MWNPSSQQNIVHQQSLQQPPPPIHQQPPQHHFNNNKNNNNNKNVSLHSHPHPHQHQQQNTADSASLRAKDLNSWCEAFDKHELVDILVKISKTNTQFQSYLGHAFVTDIKWCKIRVTFTPSNNISHITHKPPSSSQIQRHFSQYGNIKRIESFPSINSALITYDNYTFAQAAISLGIHENINNTQYNASCCYEFEGSEQPMHNNNNNNNNNSATNCNTHLQPTHGIHRQQQQQQQHHIIGGIGGIGGAGPLEQRRIFVSSLSYSTSDETLENVFSQYGELEDCTIVKDKLTARSKGYGFVVFKSVAGAGNALRQPEKFIDGRRTRSWLAAQGNQFRNNRQ